MRGAAQAGTAAQGGPNRERVSRHPRQRIVAAEATARDSGHTERGQGERHASIAPLTRRPDAVTEATREYERTGVARTIEEGAFLTFPYGHSQPTVTCAPLRACVIEFEAGESVLSRIAGDTQRWEIELAPAGPDGRTPLSS